MTHHQQLMDYVFDHNYEGTRITDNGSSKLVDKAKSKTSTDSSQVNLTKGIIGNSSKYFFNHTNSNLYRYQKL